MTAPAHLPADTSAEAIVEIIRRDEPDNRRPDAGRATCHRHLWPPERQKARLRELLAPRFEPSAFKGKLN